MSKSWTPQQLSAINSEGSILVSASAGSGKTAVLTERIVRVISEGASVSELLVVTFTNEAASEMKHRIEKRLYERAAIEDNEEKRAHIYAQAQNVLRANISTIDSFCTYILRRHFYDIGISPAFRVTDKIEAEILKEKALDEVLEAAYANGSGIRLFKLFGTEETLISIIGELHSFTSILPNGIEWLSSSVKAFNTDYAALRKSSSVEAMFHSARNMVLFSLDYFKHSLKLTENFPILTEILEDDIARVEKLLSEPNIEAMRNALQSVKYTSAPRIKKSDITLEESSLIDAIKKTRQKGKDYIKKAYALLDFSINDEAEKLSDLYPLMRDLESLVLAFRDAYSKKKAERCVVDFNDLERFTYELFNRPEITKLYSKRFRYIFFDEYQDANRLQNAIVSLISQNNNMFLVGDIKQSIYRFRNADPSLFLERQNEYLRESYGNRINLNSNFRSSRSVIDFTNMVFKSIMSRTTADIDYNEESALVEGGNQGIGKVELMLVECSDSFSENIKLDDEHDELINVEVEALLAARRVRDLMSNGEIYDSVENRMRKYRYSDFAIIVRSTKSISGAFTNVFAREGIPIYALSHGGLYDAIEVKVFINLLKIIDNRRQDIPLLSVMRSPIGDFSVEEISNMRYDFDNMSYVEDKKISEISAPNIYDCLVAVSHTNTPVGAKAKRLVEMLDRYYEESKLLSIEEFIAFLFDDTGYYRYVSALPGGKQRVLNLDALREAAFAFELGIGQGLYAFSEYLQKNSENSEASAAQGGEVDAVCMTTIHKSKGLEFNVVIIPCLEKKIISQPPKKSDVLFDDTLGIGIRYTDGLTRICMETLQYQAIACEAGRKLRADEMRLLYVALTRAKSRLILISCIKDIKKRFGTIGHMTQYPETLSQTVQTYIDWILMPLFTFGYENSLQYAMANGSFANDMLTIGIYSNKGYALAMEGINKDMFESGIRDILTDASYVVGETWKYPHSSSLGIPSKCSVTGLFNRSMKPLSESPVFHANAKRDFSAIDRGNASHMLLKHISIALHSTESVQREINELVAKGYLHQEHSDLISCEDISKFFSSDLGKRLIASEHHMREQPFRCLVPANRLRFIDSDEAVLVQGIIDCCFIENGSWIIVDYKTGTLHPDFDNELANSQQRSQYINQLSLYAVALEMLTGKPVAEQYIYFLGHGAVRTL